MIQSAGEKLFISLLIRHERAEGQLYGVIENNHKASRRFWQHMQGAKQGHIRLWEDIAIAHDEGRIQLASGRCKSHPIKASLDTLEPRTRSWESWGSKYSDAIDYAVQLERAMVCYRSLGKFSSECPYGAELISALKHEAAAHLEELELELVRSRDIFSGVKGMFNRVLGRK